MNGKISLDAGDRRVLRILQEDASLSIAEVARRAGMSQTACWRRIKRLKEDGVVLRTVAIVDRDTIGQTFVAYALVKLALPSRENMAAFDKLMERWPEVVTCERITGAVDYLLKVVSTDIKAYDGFLRLKLLDNALVSDVQSRIVVATVKDTTAMPVEGD